MINYLQITLVYNEMKEEFIELLQDYAEACARSESIDLDYLLVRIKNDINPYSLIVRIGLPGTTLFGKINDMIHDMWIELLLEYFPWKKELINNRSE
jgi:hypothetical protein